MFKVYLSRFFPIVFPTDYRNGRIGWRISKMIIDHQHKKAIAHIEKVELPLLRKQIIESVTRIGMKYRIDSQGNLEIFN